MNKKNNWYLILSIALLIVLLIVVVSPLHLFSAKDAPFQILAACLGAIVTALITGMLLNSQTQQQQLLQQKQEDDNSKREKEDREFREKQAERQREFENEQRKAAKKYQEEQDERNQKFQLELQESLQLRNNKIKAYSDFISGMYTILSKLNEAPLDKSDIEKIRMDVFSKLIFYIEPESLNGLKDVSREIMENKTSDSKKYFYSLSSITSLLRDEVKKGNEDNDDPVNLMVDIWKNLSKEEMHLIESHQDYPMSSSYNFWHFNMLNERIQLDAFRNGIYELSLIEYEETSRTNVVRQVENGDVLFLFRRGGWGYLGAFIVKGWRIFSNTENDVSETIYIDGNKPYEITDTAQIEKDIEQYDIYKSISDDATSCANLIVEPIAFDYEGVSYPGGVYRRTISRYDSDYARALLSRFVANKDKVSYNMLWDEIQKCYSIKVNANTQYFEKIISDLNIKPAEKDENGNWV